MLFGFIAILMLLLLLGMPVAFALALVGAMGMVAFLGGLSGLTHIPVIAYKTLDDFVLSAVPLYVLMSQILLKGKVGANLFELGAKWLGHLPGGLASPRYLPAPSLRPSPAAPWLRR